MHPIDIAAVMARQNDPDCTFTRDCSNTAIALEMGAEIETSLVTVAAEILMRDYVPLNLPYCSNGASHYACYIHPLG